MNNETIDSIRFYEVVWAVLCLAIQLLMSLPLIEIFEQRLPA
jgi:hypothetical protein